MSPLFSQRPSRIDRRRPRPARSTLAWSAIWFLASQLAFILWADVFQPAIYDPEFGHRLTLLSARREEYPARPLILVLGSSRMVLGFRPENLPPLATAEGQNVLAFNFSHTSAGPVYNLLAYRRLVKEGIAPSWVVVELMPLLMREEWAGVYATSAVASELPGLAPYASARKLYWGYVRNRLLPCVQHRHAFIKLNFPWWFPPLDNWVFHTHADRLGGETEAAFPRTPHADSARFVREVRAKSGMLFSRFTVSPQSEAALRRLFDECNRDGVKVALLLGPESPEFHNHYSATALQDLKEYGKRLCLEHGGRWIDAHDWLAESDFIDGHHMNLSGQTRFTDRLGKEFLSPWLREGEQLARGSSRSPKAASLRR